MKLFRKFIFTVLILSLFGCATQNLPGISSYTPIPYDSLPVSEFVPINSESYSTIIVKRDPGFMGSALSSIFLINGKRIFSIPPGHYYKFRITPDEYIFGVSWSDNMGALETRSTRELAITLKPHNVYYLRLYPQPGNGVMIERSSN